MGLTDPPSPRLGAARNKPWLGLPFEVMVCRDEARSTWSIRFHAVEGEARLRIHEMYCSLYFRREHQVEGIAQQGVLGAVLEYRQDRRSATEEFQVCPGGRDALARLQAGTWSRMRVESLSPPVPEEPAPAPPEPPPPAPPTPEEAVRALLAAGVTTQQVGGTEVQVTTLESAFEAPESPLEPTEVWAAYDALDTLDSEISSALVGEKTDPGVPLNLLLGKVAAALEEYVGLEEVTAEVLPDKPLGNWRRRT